MPLRSPLLRPVRAALACAALTLAACAPEDADPSAEAMGGPAGHPLEGKWSAKLKNGRGFVRDAFVWFSLAGFPYRMQLVGRKYEAIELNRTGMSWSDRLSPNSTKQTTVVALAPRPQGLAISFQEEITTSGTFLSQTKQRNDWTYEVVPDGIRTTLVEDTRNYIDGSLGSQQRETFEGVLLRR